MLYLQKWWTENDSGNRSSEVEVSKSEKNDKFNVYFGYENMQ